MGAPDGAELPAALREAHAIVAEQLAQLRNLANRSRADSERLSVALRQAERKLDEAIIQQRAAAQRGDRLAEELGQRVADQRVRSQQLAGEFEASQRSLKQIDQLIRQFAMSSDALAGAAADDPWALALRAQVIHGREEERGRLAREVHDGPAQVLANSLMLLETCYGLAQQAAGQERLVLMLDRLRGATREGLEEVRRFIADLRPGIVRERGLTEAIREYTREYAKASTAQIHLDIEPIVRLPEDIEIVLYRIVQEALQNAAKYARGAPLMVRLAQHDGQLLLTIRDEGPGFDPYEVARRAGRSNWGLTSMRERAELVGARLTVASRPGHGTEVTVTMAIA